MNVLQKILALLMTIIQTIMALFGIRTAAQKTGDRETARAQELASAFYSTYYDKNTGVLRANKSSSEAASCWDFGALISLGCALG